MITTLNAEMKTPEDADAFNALSIWCMKRTLNFDAVQNGKQIAITINGDEDMMKPLVDYLTDKQYGF